MDYQKSTRRPCMDCSLRPVISTFSSPTHNLVQHLVKIIQPVAEDMTSYIKNSRPFINILEKLTINEHNMLVSFDITSLSMNITVTKILSNIHIISKNTTEVIEHCTSSTYFVHQGHYNKQVSDRPIWSWRSHPP